MLDRRREEAEPPCEIGLVAVATDHAIESEIRRFLPAARASVYVTRVRLSDRYDLAGLRATEAGLADAAALLVPGSSLDVIAYGCTSATIAIGVSAAFAQLRRDRPSAKCTTPITAAMAACEHLGIRRLAALTPYPRPIHSAVVGFLEANGLAVVDQVCLDIDSDSAISQVAPAHLAEAVRRLDRASADAVFLSCTSLRTAGLIDRLEQELRSPVISSNQALAWHCLHLAGRSTAVGTGGRLLRA